MMDDVDEGDGIELYYDPDINRFVDLSFGIIMDDIHRVVSPSQILLFKKEKQDQMVMDVTNSFPVVLYYPEDEMM